MAIAQPTQNHSKYPHLAITLGDPAGIGTEVILKALADSSIYENCQVTVIGSRSHLEKTYQQLGRKSVLVDPDKLSILDIPLEQPITLGKGDAVSGEASFRYLEVAIALTIEGKFQGIVTAPIAKSCWKAAGHEYPGQTEVLAARGGVDKFGMLFVARSPHTHWTLRTLLATTHIPLNHVSNVLNPRLMTQKLDLLIDTLEKDFGIDRPQIAIAGLNPHSGEQGQLGTEERDWLNAWLEQEQKNRPYVKLIGLIPPDTMWVKPGQAWYDKTNFHLQPEDSLIQNPKPKIQNLADAYLALYHDQGLIPVKLMAFDRAINTTIGLPFIRTSPDHGTAFDIAGQGIANASSMKEAIKLAAELVRQRNGRFYQLNGSL